MSLWRYWLARGHFVEGAGWLERILEVAVAPSRERARALFALAILDARRGLGDRLPGLGDAGVAVAEQSGDPAEVVYARVLRGTLLLGSADLDEVERTATAALAEADSLGAAPVAAAARGLAAMAALFREDVPLAQQRFADCLRRAEPDRRDGRPVLPGRDAVHCRSPRSTDRWCRCSRSPGCSAAGSAPCRGGATRLSALADAHRLAGDLDSALDAVRRSVEAFADIDDAAGLGPRAQPSGVHRARPGPVRTGRRSICARRCGSASSWAIAAART